MQNGTGLKIFSGQSNQPLAQEICDYLEVSLGDVLVTSFPDNESFVRFNENIRGTDVFLIQSTSSPANHNVMELLIMIDAAKRASAARVTAVLPFFGYARQDRKDQPRVPITSKLVANILVAAGVNRILTMDLHAQQIQGFFDIPVVAKRRTGANTVEAMNLVGEVNDREILLVDDMTETAGTLTAAAKLLKDRGAKKVSAVVSHCVLNESGKERLRQGNLDELITTNSVNMEIEGLPIRQLSVAPLLGEAIRRTHTDNSISTLFEIKGF